MAASRGRLVDDSGRSSRRQCLAVHRSVWCVSRCCSGGFFLVVYSYTFGYVTRLLRGCSSRNSCAWIQRSGHRERGPSRLRDKNATKDTLDSVEHGRGDPRGMQRRYRGEYPSAYRIRDTIDREREREKATPERESASRGSGHRVSLYRDDSKHRRYVTRRISGINVLYKHNARYLSLYKVKYYDRDILADSWRLVIGQWRSNPK